MDLQALYRKLAQYKNLKNDVGDISYYLKNALNPLKSASNSIKDFYLYNDKGADNGNILLEHNKIKEIINSLDNVILPSINRQIVSLNKAIADAEAAQVVII